MGRSHLQATEPTLENRLLVRDCMHLGPELMIEDHDRSLDNLQPLRPQERIAIDDAEQFNGKAHPIRSMPSCARILSASVTC